MTARWSSPRTTLTCTEAAASRSLRLNATRRRWRPRTGRWSSPRTTLTRTEAAGVTLFALERYAEALAAHDRAVELAPDDAELHRSRGDTLRALGRHEEANVADARAEVLDR